MKILIASSNAGKVAIYSEIFKELNIDCLSLKDINLNIKVEETGATTTENAIIKAKAYHKATGLAVLSNDSGLVIEKLSAENQPGVFVRRYGGSELTDEQTIDIYGKMLNEVGGESKAKFNVSLAIIDENGALHNKDFISHRNFKTPACKERIKGLPLRSFEFDETSGKYVAQMTITEQNANEGQCIIDQTNFIKSIFVI